MLPECPCMSDFTSDPVIRANRSCELDVDVLDGVCI